MIKLVCFDLWNTLASRIEEDYSATGEYKKQFNLKQSKEEIRKVFEEVVQTKYWETEFDAYKELARSLEIAPTEKNVMKLLAIRDKGELHVHMYDFTINLLKQLQEKGYKTGLLSNSSVFIKDIVERQFNLLDYIDYPMFAYQVNMIKPDPRIFAEMQRRANVNGSEMIMVGDNPVDDVIPAENLGINAIHFTGSYEKLKEDFKKYDIILD